MIRLRCQNGCLQCSDHNRVVLLGCIHARCESSFRIRIPWFCVPVFFSRPFQCFLLHSLHLQMCSFTPRIVTHPRCLPTICAIASQVCVPSTDLLPRFAYNLCSLSTDLCQPRVLTSLFATSCQESPRIVSPSTDLCLSGYRNDPDVPMLPQFPWICILGFSSRISLPVFSLFTICSLFHDNLRVVESPCQCLVLIYEAQGTLMTPP